MQMTKRKKQQNHHNHLAFLLYFLFFFKDLFTGRGGSSLLCGLSLFVLSGGYSLLSCTGFSLQWLLLSWSKGSMRTGSVVVVHGPCCSTACGIFPDQGFNLCPQHWILNHWTTREVHLRYFRSNTSSLPIPHASLWYCPPTRYYHISKICINYSLVCVC